MYHFVAPFSTTGSTLDWPKGAISGENNGLLMYLDTESYDYVEHERGGLGFQISVVHPLDMPIPELNGINVQPGTSSKFGVSINMLSTTADAIERFDPYE